MKKARSLLRDYVLVLSEPLAAAAMNVAMEEDDEKTYKRTLGMLTREVSFENGFSETADGFRTALRAAAAAGKHDKKIRDLLSQLVSLTTPARADGDEDL
eukprot:SAG31_NODE_5062_length_2765_cov_1.297074_3_plen_100_part_00